MCNTFIVNVRMQTTAVVEVGMKNCRDVELNIRRLRQWRDRVSVDAVVSAKLANVCDSTRDKNPSCREVKTTLVASCPPVESI